MLYWDQSNYYRFHASQGKASITLNDIFVSNMLEIPIYDVSAKKEIDHWILDRVETYEFELPSDGEFELRIMYLYNDTPVIERPVKLTLSANDLVVPDIHTSGIKVLNLEPFQVVNQPLEVKIEPLTELVSSIEVLVDKKIIRELKPSEDGKFDAIQLNPEGLKEGLHNWELIIKRPESENRVRLLRLFSIDKEISFPDVLADQWARPYIEAMGQFGIVSGYPDGTFQPDRSVTRGEFARMFASIFHSLYKFQIPEANGAVFADVAQDAWYADTAEFLNTMGFIYGEEVNGTFYFYPDRTITRAEAIAIVGRLSRFIHDEPAYIDSFDDAADIPDWSRIDFAQLLGAGWIKGFPDDKLYPLNDLSRGEAVKILSKMIGMQDVK